MNIILLNKIMITVASIMIIGIFAFSAKRKAKHIQEEKKLSKTRYFAIKRIIWFLSLFVFVLTLVFIWGINVKNLWVSITGLLAMIAVAFFAVWSLVGNILAGIIIFFTSPFKLNDKIEILPDKILGKVLAINTFFTLISDEDENIISIPNSIFFQKYIKKIINNTSQLINQTPPPIEEKSK